MSDDSGSAESAASNAAWFLSESAEPGLNQTDLALVGIGWALLAIHRDLDRLATVAQWRLPKA